MKKVIAALVAIVVLILGLAVGVAVNASHLKEKERLDASDVQLALASQGMFAVPVAGDFSQWAIVDTVPVVYKANGAYILIYEQDSIQKCALPGISWQGSERYIYNAIAEDCWGAFKGTRNLQVMVRPDIKGAVAGQALRPQEMEKLERFCAALQDIFNYQLNDVKTRTLQKETEQMIFTVQQSYYATPCGEDGGVLYDNWLTYQLLIRPKSEEESARYTLETHIMPYAHEKMSKCGYSSWQPEGLLSADELVSPIGSVEAIAAQPLVIQYQVIVRGEGLEEQVLFKQDMAQ